MYICPNCNKQSENPVNFCSRCGATMIQADVAEQSTPQTESQYTQPTYQEPVYPQQPQYTQPVYSQPQYAQQTNPSSKAKAIVGMALGISGFVFAILGLLYTFLLMAIEGAAGLGVAIGFGFFSIPLSLVGLIMSVNARKMGDRTTFSKLGKVFGLIGVILSGVSLLFAFFGLALS